MTDVDPDSAGDESAATDDDRSAGPAGTERRSNPERYHIHGEHRTDANDGGSLFGGVTEASHGESFGTEAGLIAGTSDDPVLVAGVGYPLLSDLAFGTLVAHRIADWDLPDVAVADLSHTPVAAYQTFSEGDYEAIVLVGAQKRGGELNDGTPSDEPGAIHEFSPAAVDMPDTQLTELIGQTAMGFNTLDNVVVVTRALGAFPEDTRIVAVEPEYDSWGMAVEEFSDPVDDAFDEVLTRVLDHVDDSLG